ncbi:hypothetical protein ACOBV9_22695 (plasmid) [Pseudoalteromonas espejiana]
MDKKHASNDFCVIVALTQQHRDRLRKVNINTLTHSGLSVDTQLANFVKTQLLPGTQLSEQQFWQSFAHT